MNLQTQFLLQNAHFALNLFAGFIFFAIFWLYFDAWSIQKKIRNILRFLGFLFLASSYLTHAVYVEQSIISQPLFSHYIITTITVLTKIIGFGLLIISLFLDPLQKRPIYKNTHAVAITSLPGVIPVFFLPPLAAGVGFLFLRRATIGLENHLKPVAYAFFIIAFSELFSLSVLFRDTTNVQLSSMVAPFGILWVIEHVLLLIALLILRKWVFTYLLKRLQTQLFMIFTAATLGIFLVTTVAFTSLLLQNLQSTALSHLKTDVHVLSYAIESKKEQIRSDAEVIAQNPALSTAIIGDRATLRQLASSALVTKKHADLVILSEKGQVLARGEDPERIGDSMSNDPLVKRAQMKAAVSSVFVREGVLAPDVMIRAAVPVIDGDKVVGIVVASSAIDTAFLDGIKEATQLDASVYAGNIRSATTYIHPDGKSRWIGIKEETEQVKRKVLRDNEIYTGDVTILNIPYFGAYAPLTDIDNTSVGMLFVGQEQVSVLQAAARSIELTFLIAVVLLLISIVPSYIIARYLSGQLK